MKIIAHDHPLSPTHIGTICDHCGDRVERTKEALENRAQSIKVAARLATFMSIDVREHEQIHRLDLCPKCARNCLSRIRPFLRNLRQITERGIGGDRWPVYKYRYMDPAGHIVTCESSFDELK